jgi:hypothetical protein
VRGLWSTARRDKNDECVGGYLLRCGIFTNVHWGWLMPTFVALLWMSGDLGTSQYNLYPKSQLHSIPQPSCKPLEYSTLCVNNTRERLITPLNRWFSAMQNTIRCFDLYSAQKDSIDTEPTYVNSTTFSTCEMQPLNAYTTHIVYSTPSSPLGSPRLARKSLIRPC